MLRDSCDETDFSLRKQRVDESADIVRMEFQANYLAASLLMPKTNFVMAFQRILRRIGIIDKGFSPLYVDNQPCNLQNYETAISLLIEIYGVSRTAAIIRLEALGLLRDVRKQNSLKSILSTITSECREDHQDVESSPE